MSRPLRGSARRRQPRRRVDAAGEVSRSTTRLLRVDGGSTPAAVVDHRRRRRRRSRSPTPGRTAPWVFGRRPGWPRRRRRRQARRRAADDRASRRTMMAPMPATVVDDRWSRRATGRRRRYRAGARSHEDGAGDPRAARRRGRGGALPGQGELVQPGTPAGGAGAVSGAARRASPSSRSARATGCRTRPAASPTADKVALRRRAVRRRAPRDRGLGLRLAEVGAADGRRRRGLRGITRRARRPLHGARAEPGRPRPGRCRAASTKSRSSPPRRETLQPAQHQPVDRRVAGHAIADGRGRGPRPAACRCAGYLSYRFGCPFEGAVPPAAVAEVAGRCSTLGVYEVAISDTIGVAHPGQVADGPRRG